MLFLAISPRLQELAGLLSWISVFIAALISSVLIARSVRRLAMIDCMRN